MAASNLNLGKASGGVLNVQPADGTTTTNLVLPAINGTVVAADSNGNVGIGTAPYAWGSNYKALQIGGMGIANRDAGNETFISNNSYHNGTNDIYKSTSYSNKYTQQYGQHQWFTAPSGTAGNAITWTQAMTLDAGANLLVSSSLAVGSNGSSFSSSPQSVSAYHSNSNNYTQIVSRNVADTSSVFYSAIGGVIKAGILANGSFQSATNSYGSTSDAKLKENVQDASPKLDKLMQVQVRTFNYIGQEEKQIGVVAQEIEKIFPSIVYETKDTKQVEIEKEREVTLEDGTVDIEKYTEMETVETGEVTKNVKYSVIYMMMLKAMQEQNEIIKDLKSRIEILEAK